MKKRDLKQLVMVLLIFCMLLTGVFSAYAEDTEITVEEALGFSILYYYGNLSQNENPDIDSYCITPLYDADGNITYYCTDFFDGQQGKGYVVIAADVSYVLCTEMSHEGNSEYYLNQSNDYKNIYYNPFEKFVLSKKTRRSAAKYYSRDRGEVPASDVKGTAIKGTRNRNIQMRNTIDTDSLGGAAPSASLNKVMFECHPSEYLAELNFADIAAYTYSTIEPGMRAADAFRPMYSEENSSILTSVGVPFDTFTLRNKNHCVITAITNVLRYWRSICCANYDQDYATLFERVCVYAETYCEFEPENLEGNGIKGKYVDDILLGINQSYNYNGRVEVAAQGYWLFLTKYLGEYTWPVIIGFTDSRLFGENHAVVAFGYNVMTCEKQGTTYGFRFVKVNDGIADDEMEIRTNDVTPKYINWDIIENFDVSSYMFAFCPYK